MAIHYEKKVEYNGTPGLVIVSIEALSRDEARATVPKAPPDVAEMSLRDVLSADLIFPNRYTGEDEQIARQTLLEAFKGLDADNSVVRIKVIFQPDQSYRRYPSEMVDELRRSNFSEDTIREMIQWEQQFRKN